MALDHMRTERSGVEARIRQLQAELGLINDQIAEQEGKVSRLAEDRGQVSSRIGLINRTLGPLEAEVRKIELLLEALGE